MKQCFKCKKQKSLSQFYKHPQMPDGTVNKCKACNKKDVRENYIKNIEHYKAYERERFKDPARKAYAIEQARKRKKRKPGKEKARWKVSRAIRNGVLIRPEKCVSCGKIARIEAHHVDYRRPLQVTWLCRKCHRKEHGQLKYEQ